MKIFLFASNLQLAEAMKPGLDKLGELSIIIGQKMTDEQVIAQAKGAEILVAGASSIEYISPLIIENLHELKLISLLTVNVSWIDLMAARNKGITVCNVKGANSESVAEHAWGMILDLSKRITEFDRDVRNIGAYKFSEYTGKEVYGKTIGIIGLGNIGTKIARIAKAFEMKVLGFNHNKKTIDGIEQVNKETLIQQSDIIVTTVPLTDKTKNIISEKEIQLMKKGVILVNPASESLTENEAIINAVKSGKIFGFGIETDILKPVPHSYLTHPRILVTPHNAFNTHEANQKTYELAIENIHAFLNGKIQNAI